MINLSINCIEMEDRISDIIGTIAVMLSDSGKVKTHRNDAWKYGTTFENDVFSIHPYCWCLKEDCEYCLPCSCKSDYIQYTVDGVEVTFDRWCEFYRENLEGYQLDTPEYKAKAEEINSRRKEEQIKSCDNCKKKRKPNFIFKPTGLEVYWYKYLGRGTQINEENLTESQMIDIFNQSIDSFKKEA